ncbi:hypothetical protein C5E04_13140 [Pectobacterium parmentieri]|uniref:hypothetical protein n=1 Tax=Pectobacterium parmentieri TaxID=1905730 RepID=UPI000EB3D2C7|nr:hypothetical protein [Pectobacterium parmentieri]RKO80222.1 hypothetical protein C5E04_13140 [Pectobacterium parmentieri]
MKRNIFICIIIFLLSPLPSLADTVKDGVLQFYWLPQWNNGINDPELKLRFFVFSNEGKQKEVIDIKGTHSNEAFVKKNFKTIPDDFFINKEGHMEQNGTVTLRKLVNYKECDSAIWQAEFISFLQKDANFKIDDNSDSCNPLPYVIIYQLKSDVDNVSLFDKPNDTGKIIYEIDSQHALVKIKTANSDWIYVAEYDASQKDLIGSKKGYVRLKHLDPLN